MTQSKSKNVAVPQHDSSFSKKVCVSLKKKALYPDEMVNNFRKISSRAQIKKKRMSNRNCQSRGHDFLH